MSPIIIKAPVPPSGTVYEGGNLSFDVVAAGNPTLLYQWTKNTTPIPGQTGTSLALNNVTTGDSGTYAIVVTNITARSPARSRDSDCGSASDHQQTAEPDAVCRRHSDILGRSRPAAPRSRTNGISTRIPPLAVATGSTYSKANIQAADAGSTMSELRTGQFLQQRLCDIDGPACPHRPVPRGGSRR